MSLPPVPDRAGDRPPSLVELTRQECLTLLNVATVGRLGTAAAGRPAILPVNYVVHRDEVLVRTGVGTVSAAAVSDQVVAFEVDEIDHVRRSGWSVLVTGPVRLVTDLDEVAWGLLLPLRPWAPGPKDLFIAIAMEEVTGRRVGYAPIVPGASLTRTGRL